MGTQGILDTQSNPEQQQNMLEVVIYLKANYIRVTVT